MERISNRNSTQGRQWAAKTHLGFTLIELLTVISIITLLAAILFPVFSRARENARRASCQSNLKQIGMGLLQYSQDYDETEARASYGSGTYSYSGGTTGSDGSIQWKWMDAIYPYVKSERVFSCPSQTNRLGDGFPYLYNEPGSGSDTKASGRYCHYGTYNINACWRHYNTNGNLWTRGPATTCGSDATGLCNSDTAVRVSEVQDAAGTYWVADGMWELPPDATHYPNNVYYYAYRYDIGTGLPNLHDEYSPARLTGGDYGSDIIEKHLETTNILFCDGHVKAMKLDELAKKVTAISKVGSTTYTWSVPPYMSIMQE